MCESGSPTEGSLRMLPTITDSSGINHAVLLKVLLFCLKSITSLYLRIIAIHKYLTLCGIPFINYGNG